MDRKVLAASLLALFCLVRMNDLGGAEQGDGAQRALVQVPGQELNGEAGIVEYIIGRDGTITHQRFVKDGSDRSRPQRKALSCHQRSRFGRSADPSAKDAG